MLTGIVLLFIYLFEDRVKKQASRHEEPAAVKGVFYSSSASRKSFSLICLTVLVE